MRSLSGPVVAALSSGAVGLVQLIRLDFTPTPIYLNTSTWDLTFAGNVYKAAYGLGTISAVTDKPGEVQGLTLELAAGSTAIISLALDDSGTVQGTPVYLYSAIMDTATGAVLDAPLDWTGKLDTMSISEDGQSASVRVSAESRAVDLLRGTPSFYADQEQTLINAADRSFKYVVDQIDKPIVWPNKEFFKR